MKRPAEKAGLGAGGAVAIAAALGIQDPAVLAGLSLVVGAVPYVVTLLVANGGVRGVARLLWRGRRT